MSELISILMPMRNAQAFVRDALASLLSQPGVELEVVVVDDGSTDASAEAVRAIDDPRIKLVAGPERGIAAALNAGLAAATGALCCRCDADDFYPPNRLGWQRDLLRDRPDVGAVCGTFMTVTASGKRIVEQNWADRAGSISDEIRRGVGRTHFCTFLTRMPIVRQLGFREYFACSEDSDFILRLGEACDVWYEPRLSYLYRLHGESITHTKPTAQLEFFQRTILEFQRQRLATGADDLMRGTPPTIPTDGPLAPERADDQAQRLLLGEAWRHHAAGRRAEAIREGLRAVWSRPASGRAWRSVAALALKPSPRAARSRAAESATPSSVRQRGGA